VSQSTDGSESTVTVTDALGRSVTVPEEPERITLAGRAVLMLADAVYAFPSARDRVTGISRIDQGKGNFLRALDPDYGEKQILERNAGPEQVAATRPDLVILKDFMKGNLGDAVSRLGIPVVYLRLETPEDYRRDLRILGSVFDADARAEEIVRYYEERMRFVANTVADIPAARRPEALFVYYAMQGNEVAVNVPPAGWIQTTLLERAGARPVWADAVTGGGWQTVGVEQVLQWNPAELFVVSYRRDIGAAMERIRGDARWRRLAAAEADRIHAFPLDYYSWDQPDVRWILGLQWLAKTLHPERFTELSMEEELYDFFSFMYGMSRSETREIIVSSLEGVIDIE
jgi:iron complex transport system substrate-binding protein